jgi:hypothetical protein
LKSQINKPHNNEDKAIIIDSPPHTSNSNGRMSAVKPQTPSQISSQMNNGINQGPEALLMKLKEKAAVQYPEDKSTHLFRNLNSYFLENELSSNATNQIQSIAHILEINDFKNRNMKNLSEMLIYQMGNAPLPGTNPEMLYSLYMGGYPSINYPSMMPNSGYLYQGFGDKATNGFYPNGLDYNTLANLRPEVIQQLQGAQRGDELKKALNVQADHIANSHFKNDSEEKNNGFSNQNSGTTLAIKS